MRPEIAPPRSTSVKQWQNPGQNKPYSAELAPKFGTMSARYALVTKPYTFTSINAATSSRHRLRAPLPCRVFSIAGLGGSDINVTNGRPVISGSPSCSPSVGAPAKAPAAATQRSSRACAKVPSSTRRVRKAPRCAPCAAAGRSTIEAKPPQGPAPSPGTTRYRFGPSRALGHRTVPRNETPRRGRTRNALAQAPATRGIEAGTRRLQ